jgi:hypothetical protein
MTPLPPLNTTKPVPSLEAKQQRRKCRGGNDNPEQLMFYTIKQISGVFIGKVYDEKGKLLFATSCPTLAETNRAVLFKCYELNGTPLCEAA